MFEKQQTNNMQFGIHLNVNLQFQPTRFHRCQTLDFRNGIPVQKKPMFGIGGQRLLQDLLIEGQEKTLKKYEDLVEDPFK